MRIDRIPLQIENAAGTTSGPSRLPWLGYLASGMTHLAGGLVLGSVWGTTLVQLVPPPYGTNSIQLTATQMVALEATLDEAPEPPMPVTTLHSESPQETTGRIPFSAREIRPDVGEMPPASSIVDLSEATDAAAANSRQQSPPLPVTTPRRNLLPDARPVVEQTSTRLWKKSPAPPRPVTPDTAADLALPSTLQQGQDAESAPQKVHSPPPAYPAAALRQGITGRVVLRVKVDAEGTVVAAGVSQSSGHATLDKAALAGVRQWRFQPARHLGVAIEKEIAVPITFRIDRTP